MPWDEDIFEEDQIGLPGIYGCVSKNGDTTIVNLDKQIPPNLLIEIPYLLDD